MAANDEFLDQLVGSWDLRGQMGSTALHQAVEGRWVLDGLFVELHFSECDSRSTRRCTTWATTRSWVSTSCICSAPPKFRPLPKSPLIKRLCVYVATDAQTPGVAVL
jgi:hypothetical protein